MYFGNYYDLTNDERLQCRDKQVNFAKKITKFLKNREYVVGSEYEKITFRIVSVIPAKSRWDVNEYRLNVEITKVEYSFRHSNGGWTNRTPYKGERVRKYTIGKYMDWVNDELGNYLMIFGLNNRWSNKSAYITCSTPKFVNRR